jgi:hypothetical protein
LRGTFRQPGLDPIGIFTENQFIFMQPAGSMLPEGFDEPANTGLSPIGGLGGFKVLVEKWSIRRIGA